MDYNNSENLNLEGVFSKNKLRSFLLSVIIHASIVFSLSAFGKQSANYGMAQTVLPVSVNVELVASRPVIEEKILEAPKEEPIIEEIKEKEFVLPKKENPKKIEPAKKIFPVKKDVEKKAENVNENQTSQTSSSASAEKISDVNTAGSNHKVTDLQAAYLRNPPPQYPQGSRMSKEQGLVLLLVEISSDGEVDDVSVKQTSGYSRLDRAALQAVSGWVFKPTTVAGIPVADKVEVPIRFELKN